MTQCKPTDPWHGRGHRAEDRQVVLDALKGITMLMLIFVHRIKAGKREGLEHYLRDIGQFVEANEPRILHYGAYISDDGKEATNLQIHPDEDSVMFHMQVAGEKIGDAFQFLEGTERIGIYGALSEGLLAMMRQYAGEEVPVTAMSDFAGFSWLQSV